MGSRKVDARMDLAALTDSANNYFDTQQTGFDYVFFRHPQPEDPTRSPPPPTHTDAPMTAIPPSSPHQSPQQQQSRAQQQIPSPVENNDQHNAPTKCTLSFCCICTHGLPASFQTPPTWYVHKVNYNET
jgi:hypothetical protein